MSVRMTLKYTGELGCRVVHEPSARVLETDAPVDNAGRGASFSPTDLLGSALASCAVTTMGIKAARAKIPFDVCEATVDKHMSSSGPRRVARLEATLRMARATHPESRPQLEDFARGCPVVLSLSPQTEVSFRFVYDL